MSRENAAAPARPRATREDVAAKARRYLTEGRLLVTLVTAEGRVEAMCSGSGARVYRLGRDPAGWWCTCAVHGPRCSHVAALKLVTVATIRREAAA